MLHPKDYKNEFKKESLSNILRERDRLIDYMHDFENDRIPEEYYELKPDPEEIYLMHMKYMKILCNLITVKINEKHHNKPARQPPFIAIEEVISKFDEERKKHFFEDLKEKDKELYYSYLEWKMHE